MRSKANDGEVYYQRAVRKCD